MQGKSLTDLMCVCGTCVRGISHRRLGQWALHTTWDTRVASLKASLCARRSTSIICKRGEKIKTLNKGATEIELSPTITAGGSGLGRGS